MDCVVMDSVIMDSVIMDSVILDSVIMDSVIMDSVIMDCVMMGLSCPRGSINGGVNQTLVSISSALAMGSHLLFFFKPIIINLVVLLQPPKGIMKWEFYIETQG